MKRKAFSVVFAIGSIFATSSAFAASDYYMKIDGIEGEASTTIDVHSWSWGTSNTAASPRDSSTGLATGRRLVPVGDTPAAARTRGRATINDLSFTRSSDISALATLAEVQGFSLVLDRASPVLARVCAQGTHIPKVTLSARTDQWTLDNTVVSGCAVVPPLIRSGVDPAPADGRCISGQCPASMVTLTVTGTAKHTKTGHVTLLK